jgi:hypothetical protein
MEFDLIFIALIDILQPDGIQCNMIAHWRVSAKGIGMIVTNNQRLAIEIDK